MITPAQHIRLVKEYQNNGGVVSHAALKANMHPETAARYLKANAGPKELKQERGSRTYRTRPDPLKDIMPEAARYLEAAPEIEAKGLLAHLKVAKPELAEAVALRTFQRGLKVWRALHGPPLDHPLRSPAAAASSQTAGRCSFPRRTSRVWRRSLIGSALANWALRSRARVQRRLGFEVSAN